MNKTFYITIAAFCIAVSSSFYMGKQAGRNEVYTELILTQALAVEAQKDLKKSLESQVEYTKSLNEAFNKTIDLELQEWRNEIVAGEK